jgi:predicted ATP-grasp superfamily ATP-dependent carboligase
VRGVHSTEFKLEARDGRWYFIEWNPRPAYFQSIGWKAGFDLAWLAWLDHADPAQLAALQTAGVSSSFSGEHYWINLHADLMNLARLPSRNFAAWRPYWGRKEWAVFALDDLAPWRKALATLAGWVFRDKFFERALGRLAARRA